LVLPIQPADSTAALAAMLQAAQVNVQLLQVQRRHLFGARLEDGRPRSRRCFQRRKLAYGSAKDAQRRWYGQRTWGFSRVRVVTIISATSFFFLSGCSNHWRIRTVCSMTWSLA